MPASARLKASISSPGPVKSISRVEGLTPRSVSAVPPAATNTIARDNSPPTNRRKSSRLEGSISSSFEALWVLIMSSMRPIIGPDFLNTRLLQDPQDAFKILVTRAFRQRSEEPEELALHSI